MNRPSISSTPTIASPYIVIRFALSSRCGWPAIHLKNSANGPRDAFMYPAADQVVDVSFATPS